MRTRTLNSWVRNLHKWKSLWIQSLQWNTIIPDKLLVSYLFNKAFRFCLTVRYACISKFKPASTRVSPKPCKCSLHILTYSTCMVHFNIIFPLRNGLQIVFSLPSFRISLCIIPPLHSRISRLAHCTLLHLITQVHNFVEPPYFPFISFIFSSRPWS